MTTDISSASPIARKRSAPKRTAEEYVLYNTLARTAQEHGASARATQVHRAPTGTAPESNVPARSGQELNAPARSVPEPPLPPQTPPESTAGMLIGASNFSIQGGKFHNAARDIINIEINSNPPHDVAEILNAILPKMLEKVQMIQSPTAEGTIGARENDSPQKRDRVVIKKIEIRSVADRYTRSMLKCLAGYPLYVPQPFSDLSEEYRLRGIRVGDVGIITTDGRFDFLFNICPSQNTSINPHKLLKGFALDKVDDPKIYRAENFSPKSHVFESPVTRTKCLLRCPKYQSFVSGGAILELPEGASQDAATSTFPFRKLASANAMKWYRYTINTLKKDISNGSLYLITSCTKSIKWGIAVFDLPCTPQDSLRFVKNRGLFRNASPKYSWKGSSTFTTKIGPSPSSEHGDTLNQCVFVDGYKIMLQDDTFDNLQRELLHQPSKSSTSAPNPKSGRKLKQHRVGATRIRGGAGPDPSQRRKDPHQRGPTMALYPISNLPPVHPSDLINAAILKQHPDAEVSLTHDNTWRDLVKDIFDNAKELNYEGLDLAKIAHSYATSEIDENGCIYFEKIPANKSLVIAIDIGTTFSGVSYSLLEPGKRPQIQPVTRFSGQGIGHGSSKVPSIVCYNQRGDFIAAGSEADPETNPSLSDKNGLRRAEWFKLRLPLPYLAANKRSEIEKLWEPPHPDDDVIDEEILEIEGPSQAVPVHEPEFSSRDVHFSPVTDDFKSPFQVFVDFLRYLFDSAKEYITETESKIDPSFTWTSIERNTHFVLTHPNGWGEQQQSQMREAAVMAGLVGRSAAPQRITFITEGEANIYFCLDRNPNLRTERNGLLVVDCGGGTIDLSGFSLEEDGNFREIPSPDCLLQGSIFVTSRARDHFKRRFQDSSFGSDDDVETMAKAFDKLDGVKCMFSNTNVPYFVKFGGLRDNDPRFGITGGRFKVEGTQVARFFEPAIRDIIAGINDQCERAKRNKSSIKFILLVGGFGSSAYLYSRLNDYFKSKNITVLRLDTTQQNKAVADGAVYYYLTRKGRR